MSRSAILAVGGAEDKVNKREVLERFVREAGGAQARIAILPTASTIPDEKAAFYQQVFAEIGAPAVHVPIVTRDDADASEHARAIATATGVFLTGGDQSRLVSVLSGTACFAAIRDRLVEGGVLAGTSAGAAAFSATMIVGGETGLQVKRDGVRLAPGLGVITRLIIDQHFSQRERLGRLLAATALEPERLGVGIDEDTAIVYYGNGALEVIGSGQVFVLDASGATTRGLRPEDEDVTGGVSLTGVVLHVLAQGDRFSVSQRRMLRAS
jgi:cyanophycinase